MNNKEKFIQLLEDKDFVEKILNLGTQEEVKAEFEKEGIELSNDDIETLGEFYRDIWDKISELPEEELKEISAGNNPFSTMHGALEGFYKDTVAPAAAQAFPSLNKSGSTLKDGARDLGEKFGILNDGSGTTFHKNAKDWASGTMIAAGVAGVAAIGGIIYGIGKKAKWWGK